VDDECNVALRYQLASYAYTFEQAIAEDGIALDNEQGIFNRLIACFTRYSVCLFP
jgi:hypothetical protein